MTLHDLTLLEFVVVALHTITATSYLLLSINIWFMKRYLKWNKHIYPTMMWGSLLLSASLFYQLNTEYFLDITTENAWIVIVRYLSMMAMGYAVASEAKRLAHKYDRIRESEKEVIHLKGVIENMKKNKVVILLLCLFLFVNCGGLKKEITRLTDENKSKTELYEKRISELNTKISETESRETKTKTDLEIKNTEISNLKKERSQLQEQLDKKERTDFSVKNPNGAIKITDTKGNSYEFEGGQGTEINNTSESELSSKLNSITESYSQQTQTVKNLNKTISSQDNTIKKKDTEINAKKEQITKLSESVKILKENLSKQITKTGIPFYIWIVSGMFLMVLIQLVIKIYIPKNPLK